MEPDELDRKIIAILRREHLPNNTVARQLGVSEGTVRQRVKRLKENGILKIRAQINPDVLANQQLALVAINVSASRRLEATAEAISSLKGVLSVSISSGEFDIFAEVMVDSNLGLVNFLTRQLSQVDGIAKTETFLMLKSINRYV